MSKPKIGMPIFLPQYGREKPGRVIEVRESAIVVEMPDGMKFFIPSEMFEVKEGIIGRSIRKLLSRWKAGASPPQETRRATEAA